jgi:hypothetical protein
VNKQKVGRWVHIKKKRLQVRGTMVIKVKRGIQWNKWKIRVSGRVGGSMGKKGL